MSVILFMILSVVRTKGLGETARESVKGIQFLAFKIKTAIGGYNYILEIN